MQGVYPVNLLKGGTVVKKAIKKALREATIFILKAVAGAAIAEIIRIIFT